MLTFLRLRDRKALSSTGARFEAYPPAGDGGESSQDTTFSRGNDRGFASGSRGSKIAASSAVFLVLAWFAFVLWRTYLPVWERFSDAGQLRIFLSQLRDSASGRQVVFAVISYVVVVALLLAGHQLRNLGVVSRVRLSYLIMGGLVMATYVVAGLPRREAIAWEIISLLALGLAAYSLGRSICDKLLLDVRSHGEYLVLSSAFGLGALAVVSGILAHVGILSNWTVYVLLLLSIAISPVRLLRDVEYFVQYLHQVSIGVILRQSVLWKVLFPLIIGQAVFLFLAALLPETGADALSAHLLFPKWFLQAGGWVNLYSDDFHFGVPMGYNLLYAVPLALSDEVGVKLVQFWSGILSVAGAFILGRRFFGRAAGLLAAATLINVPLFAWEMQTAYVDLVFTLFGSLSIYALMRWCTAHDRRWLYAGTVLAGFALNGKLQALYVVALLPLASTVGILLRGKRLDRSVVLKDLLIPPVIAVVLGSSWYMHNLIATGNPVIPFFNGVFRSAYFPPVNEVFDRESFGMGDGFVSKYLLLPWNLVVFPEKFGGYIGAALLLLPSSLLVLGKQTRRAVLLASLCGFYAVAMAVTVPVSRYLLVILPPAAVLVSSGIVAGVSRLEGLWKKAFVGGIATVFFVIYTVNLPAFYDIRHHSWVASSLQPNDLVFDAIGTLEARDNYIAQRINTYRAQKWVSDNLPQEAKVIVYWEGRIYYVGRHALSADQVTFKGDLLSSDPRKMIEALRKVGATHLLINENVAPDKRDALLRFDSEFANRYLELLYARDGAYVFALKYDVSETREERQVIKDLIFESESFRVPNEIAKGNRVRISSLNQGDDNRRGILEVAPAQFEYSLKIPPAKTIELDFGLSATNTDQGDGVWARIEVIREAQVREVYRRFIDTNSRRSKDRRWFDERIDLTPYRGQDITLRFTAEPGMDEGSNSTTDWLLWSRPLVAVTE
ncbi:MAG: glycosyltransferase family 39 protein [Candidatus Marsarchaeota archaeon]|nr:glycosyltransferase family 39 protein [Candidatus Marsarchaeota archaeon]